MELYSAARSGANDDLDFKRTCLRERQSFSRVENGLPSIAM